MNENGEPVCDCPTDEEGNIILTGDPDDVCTPPPLPDSITWSCPCLGNLACRDPQKCEDLTTYFEDMKLESPWSVQESEGGRSSTRETWSGVNLHPNNPDSPRYWKNIVPYNYNLNKREGVTFNTESNLLVVDEGASQDWVGSWNYTTSAHPYYYPVLPKINALGEYDSEGLGMAEYGEHYYETGWYEYFKVPYGTSTRWTQYGFCGTPIYNWNTDDKSMSTSDKFKDNRLIIDLDVNEVIQNQTLTGRNGSSAVGFIVGDYKIDINDDEDVDGNVTGKLGDLYKATYINMPTTGDPEDGIF